MGSLVAAVEITRMALGAGFGAKMAKKWLLERTLIGENAMAQRLSILRFDRARNQIRVGDFVRVAKRLASPRTPREYRRVFHSCSGQVFPVVGWDVTGAAWIPLRRGGVLSVAPALLVVVRRGRNQRGTNSVCKSLVR